MSAFGSRPEEPMLTDQIDDDYDVMNDETFGGEIPNDEWDIDQMAEESEANDASTNYGLDEFSFAASKLPISDESLCFLEQSISHLVDEDDVPFATGRKESTGTKPLGNIFAPGSPQTPFFQLDQSSSIWSEVSPFAKKMATPEAVSGLFHKMKLKEDNNAIPPVGRTPVFVKGAKTAEELEAEMLGKPIRVPSLPTIAGVPVKSCEELERELIENSKAAGTSNFKPSSAPVQAGVPVQAGGMPSMPQFPPFPPNMVFRPPLQHPMFVNPQFRAAVMARFIAANQGAVPPHMRFRMPPPPMMPPPMQGPGFRPSVIVRGPHVPPMNMSNIRGPHNVDPRFVGFTVQQAGLRRGSPNFPKRRLFGSPGRMDSKEDNFERGRNHRDYVQRGDPFAGLMTRRERSWLIKIQSIQLYSENPYADDYYWMMYRRRKHANEANAPICSETDHNDNIEHRVYVPPSFEGSLGKVQVLSANFPRQVLDLNAAPVNGESKDSMDEESPRDTPPLGKTGQVVAGRRLKNVLIEIENLYLVLLQVIDLTIAMQETNPMDGTAVDRAANAARIQQLVRSIVSTIATDDRTVAVIAIRKGRRLLHQLMVYCGKEDAQLLMQAILRNVLAISKKEPHQDIVALIQIMLDKLTGSSGSEWSSLWEILKVDNIENVQKQKLGNLLLFHLVQSSAKDSAVLTEGAAKVVERWASLIYTVITGSNNDGKFVLPEKLRAGLVSSWLRNMAGAPIPPSVIDKIESHLAA